MGFPDNDSLSFAKKIERDMYDSLGEDIYKASYLTGEFKLRSGLTSTEYFDKYQFLCVPQLLDRIAHEMWKRTKHLSFDIIAGLETGGIVLATVLGQVTGHGTSIIRKKAKDYGTCKIAEGNKIEDSICLIVEDVVTTGGQIIASRNEMRKEKAVVYDAFCVIDREQGGTENLSKEGIILHSLFTMSQLKEIAAR